MPAVKFHLLNLPVLWLSISCWWKIWAIFIVLYVHIQHRPMVDSQWMRHQQKQQQIFHTFTKYLVWTPLLVYGIATPLKRLLMPEYQYAHYTCIFSHTSTLFKCTLWIRWNFSNHCESLLHFYNRLIFFVVKAIINARCAARVRYCHYRAVTENV